MSELIVKQVNFNGDNLLAIKENGKVHVAVNHICNGLGIDARIQRDKLREHLTLSRGCALRYIPSNGGNQEAFTIELEFLPLWLAGINPSRVNFQCQDKLITYQLKAKDVLAQAFLQNKVPQTFVEALRLAADLEEEKQRLLPKAQGYDYLMNASGTVTISEAATIIDIKGVGQNKFFKLLCAEEIIYKKGNSYLPYSDFKDHFIVKQNPIRYGDKTDNRSQLYLDMTGLDWLAKFLVKRGHEVNYSQNNKGGKKLCLVHT